MPPRSPAFSAATSGNHVHDQQPIVGRQPDLLRQFRSDGQRTNAQRRTAHSSVLHQVVEYGFGGVDGNGEADTGALADLRGDHGIDADHLPPGIQQRSAGVAGVDGGVGLDRLVDEGAVRRLHRADGADNAARHRSGEDAKRIADGKDLLADL